MSTSTSASPESSPRIRAGHSLDGEGRPAAFTLSYRDEIVVLDNCKPWSKADSFKWVTRGVIEGPQGFHIHPNGDIDLNGKDFRLSDPRSVAKLEQEINKRHDLPVPPAPPRAPSTPAPSSSVSPKLEFKVHLDHVGAVQIVCTHGAERIETGIRGLGHLVERGLLVKPRQFHLDPLAAFIEIDGVTFRCDANGARELESVLNTKYRAEARDDSKTPVLVTENAASGTGYDLRFATVAHGALREVHEHLAQSSLDLLQDEAHCSILQPGTVLRLSPPYLLARRKGTSAGEVRIPNLPDLQYRAATCEQVQAFLNHPLIRRSAETTTQSVASAPEKIAAMRVVPNPHNAMFFWIECLTASGQPSEGKAWTHRNLADWQHSGVFDDAFDVALSFDNRELSVLEKATKAEERVTLDHKSPKANLEQASALLTKALGKPARLTTSPETADAKPGSPPSAPPSSPGSTGQASSAKVERPTVTAVEPSTAPAVEPPTAPAEEPPLSEPEIAAPWLSVFDQVDPQKTHLEVFARLVELHGSGTQDIQLSLERVFANRRFEVLSFSHASVQSVFELRSEKFHGFYLCHINEHKTLFVYANAGRHIEWAPDKCLLQAAVSEDEHGFDGKALLGLAIHTDGTFGFVVTPECKRWTSSHAPHYREARAVFLSPSDLAAAAEDYSMVWPQFS